MLPLILATPPAAVLSAVAVKLSTQFVAACTMCGAIFAPESGTSSTGRPSSRTDRSRERTATPPERGPVRSASGLHYFDRATSADGPHAHDETGDESEHDGPIPAYRTMSPDCEAWDGPQDAYHEGVDLIAKHVTGGAWLIAPADAIDETLALEQLDDPAEAVDGDTWILADSPGSIKTARRCA